MRWELLLAPLLLTAGCLGVGSEEQAASEEVEPTQAPGNASNTSANETTRSYTLVNVTHEGTITGASTPVGAANTPDSDTVLEVQVPDGTVGLFFRVAPDGGPVRMLIAAPDCQPNSGCEEEVQAENQADAVWNTTDPASGTWTLRFFYGETGAGEVAWTLHAWKKIPAS